MDADLRALAGSLLGNLIKLSSRNGYRFRVQGLPFGV